jgi:hypothetical protein
MRVARQIGEHRFRSCERALGVDHPLTLAQRCEPVGEVEGIEQVDVLAADSELTVTMSVV